MTVREKHWLAGIQTIQFHNSNPLEEDYYFTVSKKIIQCLTGDYWLSLKILSLISFLLFNLFKHVKYTNLLI